MKKISLMAYRTLSKALSLLPYRIFYAISNIFSFILQRILGYRKSVVGSNLKLAFPDMTENSLQHIKNQFYKNFADLTLEAIIGSRIKPAALKERFVFTNPEVIDKYPNTLIIGGHQGNWEWGVLAVANWLKRPVTGVYKPLKNKSLDVYFKGQREKWGLNTIPLKQTLRWLLQNGKEPGHLVLIADQSPSNAKTAKWLTFLHQNTAFSVGPEKIAQKTGWPVFFFEVERKKRGHYEVSFHPLDDSIGVTTAFTTALEASIKKAPADWLWTHKRWKKTFDY